MRCTRPVREGRASLPGPGRLRSAPLRWRARARRLHRCSRRQGRLRVDCFRWESSLPRCLESRVADDLRWAMAATAWRSLTAFGMTFLGNGAWDRGHGSVVRRNGSAAAEFRLAAFEERARAFAHVVGGEHQAELRGPVLHCFVQRAIGPAVY